MNATRLVRLAGIGLLVFLAIQVFRPARTNPMIDPAQAIDRHVAMPPKVDAIVHRACYDCHSNQTRWPWYSGVAPMSWLVISHVSDGRQVLNFEDWNAHHRQHHEPPLDDICHQVQSGNMPIWNYLLLHSDARLSPDDVSTLCAWANQASAGVGH